MQTLFDKPKIRDSSLLEIRNYCLRLLTSHGLSYEAAERKLEEVAYHLQRTSTPHNVIHKG